MTNKDKTNVSTNLNKKTKQIKDKKNMQYHYCRVIWILF